MLDKMVASEGDTIEPLMRYLTQHDMRLMTGRASLRVQPRVLEQAASRIRSLVQLQNAATTPHTAAASGAGEDIGGVKDVLRLEALQRLLSHVRWLRVESALPGLRDPTGLSFEPFSALRKLELRGCDLSTCAWEGLPLLQERLQELRVADTLEALHHLLAPHALAVTSTAMAEMASWQKLRVLACSRNCIVDLDPSLTLLPALQSLMLVHSNISTVANLQACTQLTSLDLSHNRISSLTGLAALQTAPLTQLSVEWNSLRSTDGIENLPQLRVLDLGFNYVCSVTEAVRLSGLSELHSLRLAGNPLAFARSYRCDVLSVFNQSASLRLDGAGANGHERHRLRERAAGGRLSQISKHAEGPDEGDRWQNLVDEMLGPVPSKRSFSQGQAISPMSPSGDQAERQGMSPDAAQPGHLIDAFSRGWHGAPSDDLAAAAVPPSGHDSFGSTPRQGSQSSDCGSRPYSSPYLRSASAVANGAVSVEDIPQSSAAASFDGSAGGHPVGDSWH